MPTIANGENLAAPQEWTHTPSNHGLVWHHVIPYSRLRDLWNAIVRATQQQVRLAEPALAIRQYMGLCGMPIQFTEQHMNALRAGTLEYIPREAFKRRAVWPCWDIVEGPGNRVHDPGNNYIDRFTIGLTPEELRRMDAVIWFNTKIMGLPLQGALSAGTLASIADAAQVARRALAGCVRPIPFRENIWEQVGNGQWRKRRA